MKNITIEYYDAKDNLLCEEKKEIEEGSYLDTIIDKATDPFDNPHYFSNEMMHEIDGEPIATEYVIVKEVEMEMKEVIIEYFNEDGRMIKSEVSGAIEGTPIYGLIGTLFTPDEIMNEVPDGAVWATMREYDAPKSKLDEILETVKRLSDKETKTFIQRALKLSEETGEVAEAVLSYMDAPGCGYKKKEETDVVEESIDVIIMALSIIFKTTADDNDILNTFRTKLSKWESKMN